ncbi:MAG: peptide deformylase [Bdellovibrionales bacterium]|nr:peptide deformylase [Bdellovibrionales bacterium]
MAILEVLKFPDSRLKKLSKKLNNILESDIALSLNMLETMYKFRGIGLAAPQVGQLKRLIVIDIRSSRYDDLQKSDNKESDNKESDNKEPSSYQLTDLEKKISMPLVLFNPEIIESKSTTTFDEGCLSIPGYYETVQRKKWVKVKYQNEKKEFCELQSDGLLSICIQHEIDHLDGKLFLDRLSFVKSKRLKTEIKKHGYDLKEDTKSEE